MFTMLTLIDEGKTYEVTVRVESSSVDCYLYEGYDVDTMEDLDDEVLDYLQNKYEELIQRTAVEAGAYWE